MENIFKSLPDEKKPIVKELEKMAELITQKQSDFPDLMMTEWKGYKFSVMFNAKTAQRAYEEMEFEENTVFLVSYPKTGTSWTAEIMKRILYGDDEKLNALSKSVPTLFYYLEMCGPEKLDLYPYIPLPRKMFITHLPEELLNFEKIKRTKGKVVVVIRNPKDQAVSWFHFSKNMPQKAALRCGVDSSDWNQFLSDYVQGKHPNISKPGEWYPDHVLGWYKHKDEDNVLFLHYEDMKEDLQREIKKLADFVDVNLSKDRIDNIAKETSFDAMKKRQEEGRSESAKFLKATSMLRKGQVGSWKNTFTVAQSEMMDRLIEEKLGRTDIKFTYE